METRLEDISFAGQVAVVTGAGRGIGRAYAIELARRGASVVVNDLGGVDTPEGAWADHTVRDIRALGGRAAASHDSVATIEGGQAITDTAMREFGGVDIVINNAGFLRRGMFADMPLQHAREIVDVHLLAGFYVTQPAWKIMAAKGYGRVVFTSSAASFGMQANSNYVAAKAGLLGLASALALEGEASGIKVNSILPYAKTMITVDSPAVGPEASGTVGLQNELAPRMTMASVAAAALYLASPACSITGQAISALAGRYARCFLSLTRGWLSEDAETVSPEDFRGHVDEIVDASRSFEPGSLKGELVAVIEQLRARGKD
jgi:NAD(P)-dependent dehydrogenase (short-subunit alcohol dehydrogenase family)